MTVAEVMDVQEPGAAEILAELKALNEKRDSTSFTEEDVRLLGTMWSTSSTPCAT